MCLCFEKQKKKPTNLPVFSGGGVGGGGEGGLPSIGGRQCSGEEAMESVSGVAQRAVGREMRAERERGRGRGQGERETGRARDRERERTSVRQGDAAGGSSTTHCEREMGRRYGRGELEDDPAELENEGKVRGRGQRTKAADREGKVQAKIGI